MAATATDLARFLRGLAGTLERGANLERELPVLIDSIGNKPLRAVLRQVERDLVRGVDLHDALAEHGRTFAPGDLAQVKAGQTANQLPLVLRGLAERHVLAEQIRQAMRRVAVPVAFGACLLTVATVLGVWMAGHFASLFADLGMTLPLITRLFLKLADVPPLAAAAAVLAFLCMGWLLVKAVIIWTDLGRFEYWVPIWGTVASRRDLANYCSSMAALSQSSTPLPVAAEISAGTVRNASFREVLLLAHHRMAGGVDLYTAFSLERRIPLSLTWAIGLAQSRSDVPDTFRTFSRLYMTEMEVASAAMIQTMSPIGILLLVNIAFLAFSVLGVPIFRLLEGVSG